MSAPKAVNCTPISREVQTTDGEGNVAESEHYLYTMMDELIAAYHPDLSVGNIQLWWKSNFKEDRSGMLVCGRCHIVDEKMRQVGDVDIIIELNEQVFNDPDTTNELKRAIMDHELCHPRPIIDNETGDQREDVQGRKLWFNRKHDLEEFREIVERHGFYRQEVQDFATTFQATRDRGQQEGEGGQE